jgi:hypothetical protein
MLQVARLIFLRLLGFGSLDGALCPATLVRNEIPPTAVGGSFKSDLQIETYIFIESHQRQLVDRSSPAFIQAGSETSTNCRWWDSAS